VTSVGTALMLQINGKYKNTLNNRSEEHPNDLPAKVLSPLNERGVSGKIDLSRQNVSES